MESTNYVTELEKKVIENIISSEYMDASGEGMINYGVWSFSATNEDKKLAGALGSLVKKGLCFAQTEGSDHVCGLTLDGFHWAKNNEIIK